MTFPNNNDIFSIMRYVKGSTFTLTAIICLCHLCTMNYLMDLLQTFIKQNIEQYLTKEQSNATNDLSSKPFSWI